MKKVANRRDFLKLSVGATGGAVIFSPISKAIAMACGVTPAQTAGPFYPGEKQFQPDNDLTLVPGGKVRAQGQVVYIQGKVLDQNCKPVKNANVEIWQACASGKYNNSKDPNPAPLDPNFKYWGEAFTNDLGEYQFKTIIPGSYPADTEWVRPPHIHFRISSLGHRELVTQMYFKGDALNDIDLILLDIPKAERNSVVVEFIPANLDFEPGSLIGKFDITLRSIRG